MKAEIIAVGTEILLGEIVNTNAAFLSEYLSNLGFDLYHQQVVGDNEDRLLACLEEASNRSDLVVVCGGLGPTEDDLTKQTTAKFLHKEIRYDEEAMKRLEAYFANSNRGVTENNKRQALTIEGGTTLQNDAGLACGVLYQADSTSYLLLPGPPREMKAMAEGVTKKLLQELLPNDSKLVSRYLRYIGIGESKLAEDLHELITTQTNPTIATYAKTNEVMLRIAAKAKTEDAGQLMLDALEEKINQKVGEFFYGYGENLSLEEVVIDLLKTRKETLSVVEGVSGGLCQGKLTDIKGSSEVFLGGMVTYSNKSKQQLLNLAGVQSEEILIVGKEQAIKLAESIKKVMGTDYGLSIIGVAGPERVDNLPVGSIFIALATNEGTISYEVLINRERDYIKDGAVKQALNLLRKKIIS